MASGGGGSGDIVVVGSANADVVVSVERLPLPGETLEGSGLETCAGGKGANQAAAAARLLEAERDEAQTQPQRARLIALLGDDASGASLRAALEASNVDASLCRALPSPGTPTGTALVLLLPSGENSIVIVGGANQSDEGWEGVLGGSGNGDDDGAATTAAARLLSSSSGGGGGGAGAVSALLLQREVPDWVNARAAELAAGGGAAVVLDAGGAEGTLPDALLSRVHVLSPNETELARLVAAYGIAPPPVPCDHEKEGGSDVGGPAQLSAEMRAWVERAARALLARLVAAAAPPPGEAGARRPASAPSHLRRRAVLVKLGAAGSALFTALEDEAGSSAALWQPALRPEGAVVDTTGAGDCFTAAFAVARFAEGRTDAEALRFASAAACLCVQRRGAQPSMPRRGEVEALLLRRREEAGGAAVRSEERK